MLLKTTTSSKNWNRPKTSNSANSGQKKKEKLKKKFLLANFLTVIQRLLNSYTSITQSLRTDIPLCQVHSCSDLLGTIFVHGNIFLPTSLYLEHLHNYICSVSTWSRNENEKKKHSVYWLDNKQNQYTLRNAFHGIRRNYNFY